MTVRAAFDWKGLEQAAMDHVIATVRQVRQAHPDERIYGAMFHAFYGDGSVIYWPCLTVGTEETLAQVETRYRAEYGPEYQADVRWSGADLVHNSEPGGAEDAWAKRCHGFAARDGSFATWEKVYDRFLHCFPRAARRARTTLVRAGTVGKEFVVIAADDAGELVPLSLTEAQVRKHFPWYDQAEQERQRIAMLPVEARIAELLPYAVHGAREPGILIGEYEGLLRRVGEPAVAALVEVVTGAAPGDSIRAIMLLAEINHETQAVVDALTTAMLDRKADTNTRAWAAAALARLDHMGVVVAHLPALPVEVMARGLTAPYRSFRDRGKHRPLDYRPLEAALRARPQIEAAVAQELAPGRGYCSIADEEVTAAQAGLDSPFELIRIHAAAVLEDHEGRL
jgi:hypothetical protein